MPNRAFNIPIDSKTLVTDQVVAHKGAEYAVSQITGIAFHDSKQSMNFVPIYHIRSLSIRFADGHQLSLWSQHPIIQKTKFKNLATAFSALSEATFRQRLQRYIDAWTSVSYFDYGTVRFHADGSLASLKNTTQRISLVAAISQNRVGMGKSVGVSWIGYSESDPYCVGVYEKPPGGLFSKNRCVQFNCNENRDVILALLHSLDKAPL